MIGKRIRHYDYVFLTDCPYEDGERLLDKVIERLEEYIMRNYDADEIDVPICDVCYVGNVENKIWTLKFRTEVSLERDEFKITV